MKTIAEMKARLREINTAAETAEGEALNVLLKEAEEIKAKIDEAENRARIKGIADGIADGCTPGAKGEGGDGVSDSAKKRGEALMAGKKVQYKDTLTSSSTVLTQHTAQDVKPTFNDVSSLVDRVMVVPLPGGESYKRGFEKGNGTGGYTAEGADYNVAEPTFGYAEMAKTKITAYCEEPEEIAKLAPAGYDTVIGSSSERAVRKYLSRQILVGAGGAGKLYGIFYNPSSAADDIIDRNTDISLSTIDENTLDNIIYAYGGAEDVEDVCVLILNKQDVKAFSKCRKSNGDRAYVVKNNGNTGTIDDVPYIINSACGIVCNNNTVTGTYCMAYGPLSNYELPVFSDMDVQRSTEYKFKQGQIAHRADIFVGGNVAAWNGFVRVKKGSAGVLTVTSLAGETTGKTAIIVNEPLETNHSYKYKTAASVTAPAVGDTISSGYTNWDGESEITATTGNKILIVEVDADNKCVASGIDTVTSKA